MSVAQHLGIRLAEYDRRIRSFIPRYAELLGTAASMLAAVRQKRPTIVDLGIGTGALASRCLAVLPDARLVGFDADEGILALARRRLARRARRGLELRHANFERVELPRCQALVASLALHHIPTKRRKAAFYRRCFEALDPGGLLVDADCHPGSAAGIARLLHDDWRRHMRCRYDDREVTSLLRAWAKEDCYFPVEDERAMLTSAGFDVDVAWRRGSFAVIVGTRR